jgi:hypothetical protein
MIPGAKYVTTPGVHNDANKTEEFSKVVIDFLAISNKQ